MALNQYNITFAVIFLAFFDRCALFLYLAPAEILYFILFFLLGIGAHIKFLPKRSILFYCLFVLFALLGVTSIHAINGTNVDIKYLIGQYLLRMFIIIYLLSLVNQNYKFVILSRFVAVFSLLICVFGVLLIVAYGRLDFFRNVIYQGRAELEFLKYTEYFNPNAISRFLLMLYPIGGFYYLRSNRKRLFVVYTILVALVLISAQSRIGLLIFSALSVVMIVRYFKSNSLRYTIIAGLSILVFPTLVERVVLKVEQYELLETTARLEMAIGAISAIQERPFIGYGAGNSALEVHARSNLTEIYSVASKGKSGTNEVVVHSSLLQAMVDLGLPLTLFCYFSLCILLVKSSFKIKSEAVFVLCLSVQVFLLTGLTASNLGSNLGWVMVGLFLANIKNMGRVYYERNS